MASWWRIEYGNWFLAGFFLFLTGSLVNWPTLPTVLMFPVLLVVYARLARIEEEEAIARFGDGYLGYAAVTPRFLPFPRPRPRPVQSSA